MVGYKVGQKVLLLDGTLLNIEDVQEGMSLQTIVLPNDDNVKEAKYWSSKEINELEFTSSEVNKVSTENQDYITINELSLRDKEILVYNTLNKTFEFKNVNNLYLGDDHKLVRITNESILLENIYNYEKSTNKEDLISISLHGPFHYLLDGYVVHNVGTICIQNCDNPTNIACINNTLNLAVGFNGFVDTNGSCWIPISDCPSCTPSVVFIGQVASGWFGTSCDNCPGESGTTPPDPKDLQDVSDLCKIKLAPCSNVIGSGCPTGEQPGECSYPLSGLWVTVQQPSIIPCPFIGQIVTVNSASPNDSCCYIVTDVDDKAISQGTVIITQVFSNCTDCCSSEEPTPTPTLTPTLTPTPTAPEISYARYRAVKCCDDTQFLDVQAPVFTPIGSTFVIANE